MSRPRMGGVLMIRERPMPDFLDTVLYWVFPTDCAACGRPAADRRLPFFCRSCWDSIRPFDGPLCPRCGCPFDSPLALAHSPTHTCRACREKPPRFDRALSPYRYDGAVERAIRLFKYRRRDALAEPLANLMLVWTDRLPPVDLVMPVPLHPRKLRAREFNQALLLADRIARHLGLPLSFESLVRHRETKPQTELDRAGRVRNVRRAFAVREPDGLDGRRVLLVDDVLTTGTSLAEVVKLLRSGSADLVGIGVLIDRSEAPIDFGVDLHAACRFEARTYPEDDLPDWLQRIPVSTPGTRAKTVARPET